MLTWYLRRRQVMARDILISGLREGDMQGGGSKVPIELEYAMYIVEPLYWNSDKLIYSAMYIYSRDIVPDKEMVEMKGIYPKSGVEYELEQFGKLGICMYFKKDGEVIGIVTMSEIEKMCKGGG